ncbi:DegT/DnrJ/EryC1/StrS aminotransferase family protein [Cellulomonas sp. PS-H5]|uniref:DegT/DnrJ/EryC1/StrS family aminotransferase n=1 Tax=Cellulomonas sp. PS-H5 TaxID=2820400 RepID=UPI001C4E974C|nr:DegT/DnrJ/EryC1/StrS family aminotransferase [Cellulomonas sp. PS-H5]MBW0254602.1 DegT/DnrJ/EryC1/StrS family aminotransferase [Cellulomonas sp. PS-H5]
MSAVQDPSVTVPLNDLSRALRTERAELVDAMTRVVDSGWLVHGPEHAGFEHDLAAFLGVPHVLGVASGTDALELALRAVVPADRPVVLTAANCGGYTTTAARRAGFEVRYADVDPVTHLLTAETLAPVLDAQVGAVVVTHLYGRSADVAAVRAACEPLGVRVVEDCAQALGATRPEGRVGSLGDVAAFSFYPTKNLGALGDGGAVATRSADVAQAVGELRQYGWRGKYTIGRTGGVNSRLDEVQAAVLRTRLPRLDAGNARRRAILAAYADAAPAGVRVLPAAGADHAAHLAVVETDRRDDLVVHLQAHGVRTDVHYPVPDHRQPALVADLGDVHLPVSERLAASVLSLPLFPELTDDEVARVAAALGGFA